MSKKAPKREKRTALRLQARDKFDKNRDVMAHNMAFERVQEHIKTSVAVFRKAAVLR